MIRMSDTNPKKKLTRKRLGNALVELHKQRPNFFTSPPTRMTFFEHVNAGNLEDIEEFLEEPDFNINMRDSVGNSALFFAMDGAGGLPMVKLLLDNGADINQMNFAGEVPLHILCRDLTSINLNQLEILQYLINQENLILFPAYGRPIEHVFQEVIDDIESFDKWISDLRFFADEIRPEEDERHTRQMKLLIPLTNLSESIRQISEQYMKYVNVVPENAKEKVYHHLDIRMTGSQLKDYIQKQVFHNPFMNLDFIYRGKLLDLTQPLGVQNVTDGVTITFSVRLVSGTKLIRGGRKKTQRKRS